jgi:hypothetical protein
MPKDTPGRVPKLPQKARMPQRSEAVAGDEAKNGMSPIPAEQMPERPASSPQR